MSSNAPAIPLFGDSYLADTRHLSLEEHGAYLQLLMIAWRMPQCALPDDDQRISRMLGVTPKKWARLRPAVMAFWTRTGAGWEQLRLSKERRFVAKKSEQNREAANARWDAKSLETNEVGDADASSRQCDRNAPPPSPTISRPKGLSITRAAAMPDGWSVPVEWRLWAVKEFGWSQGQADGEATRFVDNAAAHGRKYKDWLAAWRNWCRSPYCQTKAQTKEIGWA